MGYGFPGSWMGGWSWFGMGLGLVFWALLIGLVAWIVVSLAQRPAGPSAPRPEDVLRARYARGEITREEYEHTLQVLRQP